MAWIIMLAIVIIGVGIAFYMLKRTTGEGKYKSTNPEAGSRPQPGGPSQSDR